MELRSRILSLLEKDNIGLTIEEVSRDLEISRPTASKYLFAMSCEGNIIIREVGKAKLHYLRKTGQNDKEKDDEKGYEIENEKHDEESKKEDECG